MSEGWGRCRDWAVAGVGWLQGLAGSALNRSVLFLANLEVGDEAV